MTRLTVASAGLGHGSTALIIACVLGELGFPKLDRITFADTGSEAPPTYSHATQFAAWVLERGASLHTVRKKDVSGSLHQSILDRIDGKRASASPIPTHLAPSGRGMQGCTRDWKMRPLDGSVKRWAKGQGKETEVDVCIGYTVEEVMRVPGQPHLDSLTEWPTGWRQRYPLIENRWDRGRCVAYIEKHLSWPVTNSCCTICAHRPTTGPGSFAELQQNEPEAFAEVVKFDAAIRDGSRWGMVSTAYLSSLRMPLVDAIREAQRQQTFAFAAGDGSCDGGSCWT